MTKFVNAALCVVLLPPSIATIQVGVLISKLLMTQINILTGVGRCTTVRVKQKHSNAPHFVMKVMLSKDKHIHQIQLKGDVGKYTAQCLMMRCHSIPVTSHF